MDLTKNSSIRPVRYSPRSGFTILELSVVMSIMGAMLGMILPAINSARETARNIQCVNHLHQIGIALHNYHNIHSRLPAGWRDDNSQQSAFGWGSSILPFLDESALYSKIDFESSIDHINNRFALDFTPSVFRCPSDIGDKSFTLYEEHGHESGGTSSKTVLIKLPSANYIAVFGESDPDDVLGDSGEGTFIANRFMRFADIQKGLSNTLLVGERTSRKLSATWIGVMTKGEDAPGRLVGNAFWGPNRADADECEFDSRHPGHTNFLWGDGRVKSISDSVDMMTYRKFSSRY